MAEHQEKTKKGRLFDDLSVAQVLAGALAAVTSMLLASRIGIYGSVIGVAVGSIVSAVASQLYKKFLTASAEKLRELKPGDTGYLESVADGSTAPESASGGAGAAGESAEPLLEESPTERLLPSDKTAVIRPVRARRSLTPRLDDDALEGDATVERVRARRERKRKLQRRIVVASIASALGAVLLTAVAVDLLTQGEGLGERPAPLVSSTTERSHSADDASAQQGATSKDSSADSSKSGDDAKDTKDEQGSSGSSDTATKPDADKGAGDNTSNSGSNSSDSGSAGSGSAGTGGSESGSGSGSSGNASGDTSGNSGNTGSESGSGSGNPNNPSTPTKPGETTPSTSPTSAPAPSSR